MNIDIYTKEHNNNNKTKTTKRQKQDSNKKEGNTNNKLRTKSGRREFFKTGFKFSCFIAATYSLSKIFVARHDFYLRPPGADDEARFLANCIKCGQCVLACPYDTLKLAGILDEARNGTPFFTPREVACYLCEDIPCIAACPTDALDKSYLVGRVLEVRMGTAVVDTASCVAHFGVQCDACYRACPVIDKALKLGYERNERTGKHGKLIPVVDASYCTGCGLCEQVCITEKPAIRVMPRTFIKGKINDNYIKGWEEEDELRIRDIDEKVKLNKDKALDYLNELE